MCLNDAARNGQAQSSPTSIVAVGIRTAEKRLKHVSLVVRMYAASAVANRHRNSVRVRRHFEGYRFAVGTVGYGIFTSMKCQKAGSGNKACLFGCFCVSDQLARFTSLRFP